jgi:hypothetical protein
VVAVGNIKASLQAGGQAEALARIKMQLIKLRDRVLLDKGLQVVMDVRIVALWRKMLAVGVVGQAVLALTQLVE